MRTFKLIMLTTLIIVSSVGSLSCVVSDEKAIQRTVTGFFTAYEKEEYSRSLEFLSDGLKASIGEEELINRLRAAKFLGDFTRLKSTGELKIGTRTATIWVDLEGFRGIVRTIQVSLVKEDEEWKINNY